ncbi:hypothetical protein IV203_007349 [Nitzschia inconspicua]|uniref:Uncharacterized protein n=1 Tax=Nitzschia inconspicua TaxID=303405 RepID=A0A9K3KEG0_9STRA|nr:hypothetical protein IV203_007349 [Nitzschia inconspicua]
MPDFPGNDDGNIAVKQISPKGVGGSFVGDFLGGSEGVSSNIDANTFNINNPTTEDGLVVTNTLSSSSSSIAPHFQTTDTLGPPPPSSQPQARTFPRTPSSICGSDGNFEARSFGPPRAPPSSTLSSTSVSSSFAQLAYRTFENYMNETRADQFPQLQMLDDVNLCSGYTAEGLSRLGTKGWKPHYYLQGQQQPLEPVALRRHIHSTPLRHTPSIVDSDDEDEPPPIGLEILSRSRSTPLSTSKNSAFGTILRTNSHVLYDGVSLSNRPVNSGIRMSNGSAFSLPPYPIAKANSRSAERDVARPVIFNPIKCHEDESDIRKMEFFDGGEEMTSIEVTNLQHLSYKGNKPRKEKHPKKQNTASRAARFLADVRNLRISTNIAAGSDAQSEESRQKASHSGGRAQRPRGGRENPAKPPSVSSNDSLKTTSGAGSIADDTLSSKSSSGDSNCDAKRKGPAFAESVSNSMNKEQSETSALGSKLKELKVNAETLTKLKPSDSPASIPSPVYHSLQEFEQKTDKVTDLVCIEVNTNDSADLVALRQPSNVSSPEPGEIASRTHALNSHHSPDSTRYSSTTSSSGQTAQSSRSGYVTHLSVISETDREVANLNNFSAGGKMDVIELSLSTDKNLKFGDYVELVDSPSPVNISRDGASVQADRFFGTNGNGGAKRDRRSLSRLRTLPSLNKRCGSAHSPTTVSSASVNTNSSSSSMGSEPPKIVSYFDRKQVSDLTSLHNRGESTSSPRAGLDDKERRDSSPSDQILVGDSDVVFEGAHAPKIGEARKPRPMWAGKGLHFGRKIRSLPPRSPYKGLRSSTTPPPTSGGSPAQMNLSPSSQLIENRRDPNSNFSTSSGSSTSTYCYTGYPVEPGSQEVVRLSPSLLISTSSYVMVPRGLSPIGGQAVLVGRGSPRTYEETNIEIFKTNSKDDSSSCNSSSYLPVIFSDKNGNSSR